MQIALEPEAFDPLEADCQFVRTSRRGAAPGRQLSRPALYGVAGNLLLDEGRESTRLGARLSTRRKYRPEIERRQQPVFQHGSHRSRLQLRREQPFGAADGDAEAREHAFANAFRGTDPQPTVHNDSGFRRSLPERPGGAAGALLVDDGLMRGEIVGGVWHPAGCEIGGP